MNILPEIRLVFRDKQTKIKLSNLIFYFSIPAQKKNDYSVGPFITGSKGEYLLFKDEIKRRVEKSLKDFSMDYGTPFEELNNFFHIKVDTKKDLEGISEGIKKFYPEESKTLKKLLENCYNDKLRESVVIKRSFNNKIEEILI